MRIILAFKVFFGVLFSGNTAEKVSTALLTDGGLDSAAAKKLEAPKEKKIEKKKTPPKPVRSEALTLLAALQREARLVDFLQENLDAYEDAQIGAAVRDVHRDSAAVIERFFALAPIRDEEEGARIETPDGFDPAQYKLTGSVTGEPPFAGQMAHHGWQASRCELPEWTGSKEAARVVAPVEIEM